MVKLAFHPDLKKAFSKIKDKSIKEKLIKQFSKIKNNPGIGKPMKYARKGTRELYVGSFRLSYAHVEDKIIFLNLYHKDEQ